MTSFSNPNPSDNTLAALQARQPEINAPNTSGLIAAMLQDQYHKQALQQALMDRVTQSIGSIRQSNDAGQLADYIQNNSPYVNSDMVTQLQGMSPQARLRALQFSQQQNADEDQTARQNRLDDIKAQLEQSKSDYYDRRPTTREMTPRQDAITNNETAKYITKDIQDKFGMLPGSFGDVTHGDFDAQGNWVPNEQGKSGMIGKPIITWTDPGKPAGWFSSARPPGTLPPTYDYQNVYPRDTADQGAAAVSRYKQILANPMARPTGVGPTGGAGAVDGSGNAVQDPVGTKRTQNGVTYEFDGAKWNPVQ